MADEFDPENFNWDGEDGINLDDVGPDIVEEAVRAALNAHEAAFGWTYLKRSDVQESAGRLFRAPYFMKEKSRKWFEENFPAYTFVWDAATGHHDHPISNLARELNELEMVEDLVRHREQYIDLFGSGTRDRKYKRNCVNLYTLATAKDYFRYQKLGANDILFDMEKLCDPTSVLGKIDRLTCTHALYYLKMSDIGRIVNTSRQRRLSALVHRHSSTHGFLNDGEQEYWVSEDGVVTQINVATGEKYTHPSLEALFHQGSAKTEHGGVAWTIRAAGGDSFFIDFVGCPNEVSEVFVPLALLKPESRETYTFSSVTVKKFLQWTWMSAAVSTGEIMIEDIDLFNELRRYVAGKQRTPRLKTETMNHARRLCNKRDIISIHGGGAHEIPVASMADYVEVSFYVDVKSELDAAISFHRENATMTLALNKYYEKGELPRDFTVVTGAAAITSRTFSDAAIKVINSLADADFTVESYLRDKLPSEDYVKLGVDTGPGTTRGGGWWA